MSLRFAALLPILGVLPLLACEPEPDIEVWQVRADPSVCDSGNAEYLCATYERVDVEGGGALYETVEGFEPQWGHTYEITVERHELAQAPIDGSSIVYELVEVHSDEVLPSLEFEIDLRIATVDAAAGTGEVGPGVPFTCPAELCEVAASALEQGWLVAFETQATFRFGPTEALLPLELVSIGE